MHYIERLVKVLVLERKFNSIGDIQRLNKFACSTCSDIWIHSYDNTTMVDAKSVIGIFCLDFTQTIRIVTEDEMIYDILKKMFREENDGR